MGATIPAVNPRTGVVDFHVPVIGHDEVVGRVETLRANQPAWAALSVDDRGKVLRRFAELVEARRDDLVAALVQDTGRVALSHMEVDSVVHGVPRALGFAADVDYPAVEDGAVGLTIDGDFVPYEVVGVIAPWNFPLQLALIDAIPALAAGCSVVLKPSEVTPRFVPVLVELIAEVPELAAVFDVVTGGPDSGRAVTANVDVVCFTGSVPTGRAVGRAAAERGIPAYLELGGKDPVVVTEHADIDVASSAILWGSTANSGHSCMSLERAYVHASVFDDFVDRLVTKAEQVRLAHPAPTDGDIGPIIERAQVGVIAGQLEQAVAAGATIRTGGEVLELDGGRYLRPTVVTDVDHDMSLMRDETFGPVIAVMPYHDDAEAVALANDSTMGLSGAVFSQDLDQAQRIASQMRVGAVSVNDVCLTGIHPLAEKNSFGDSGTGPSRMGPSAVRRFLRRRAALIRPSARHNPWYYELTPAASDTSDRNPT